MRLKLLALSAAVILVVLTVVVQAGPESAASSGWGVTTNYHGQEVLISVLITDPLEAQVLVGFPENWDALYEVTVVLRDPDDEPVATITRPKNELDWQPGTAPNGRVLRTAWIGPLIPDTGWTVGHYSVKAYFYADDGTTLANDEDLSAMRATTQVVIPEAPIGTLTIIITMLASLAIFARKKF